VSRRLGETGRCLRQSKPRPTTGRRPSRPAAVRLAACRTSRGRWGSSRSSSCWSAALQASRATGAPALRRLRTRRRPLFVILRAGPLASAPYPRESGGGTSTSWAKALDRRRRTWAPTMFCTLVGDVPIASGCPRRMPHVLASRFRRMAVTRCTGRLVTGGRHWNSWIFGPVGDPCFSVERASRRGDGTGSLRTCST
jgi:hypothetical protein